MGSGYSGSFGGSTSGAKIHQEQLNHSNLPNIDDSNIYKNATEASKYYYLNKKTGLFGEKGDNVRVIKTTHVQAEASMFYNLLKQGGKTVGLPNKKGTKTTLPDGTIITYRPITKTKGSPAVQISISASPKIKDQKFILLNRR